jgi:YVTN family beta-propeller protein
MRASDPYIGSVLLGYQIEEVIGRGGMGVVYRARDRALDRNVALKVVAPEYAGITGFRSRFLAESRIAASLEHPNVVPIYGAGDQDGHLYIAMRYIEGRDLRQVLRDGVLTPARAVAICGQVADALDAAHEQGLVHRDVKPSNILLDASDRAYLADFGLTRLSSDPNPEPGIGASLGTIDYVAPEQIRGDALDGRADIYSLGCVLFECLTGSGPFSNRSDVALLYAHLEEIPPAPPGLEDVMRKALAKDPHDRYRTCGELVEAAARTLGVSHERRARRRVLAVAAAVAVVAMAVVAGLLARSGPPTQGTAGPPTQGSPDMSGRLIQIDPETGSTLRSIPIGTEPTAVAVGDGGVWAASYPGTVLWKVDRVSGDVATVPAFAHPLSLAATKRAAYAVFDTADAMERFPPAPGPPVKTELGNVGVSTLGDATQVATGPGGDVWGLGGDTVYRVVRHSEFADRAVDLVRIPYTDNEERGLRRLSGLAVGTHTVWVTGDVGDRRLWRIDTSGRPRVSGTMTLGFAPADVAVGFGHVWVTGQLTDTLYEIDPATLQVVRAIPVGREPKGVSIGAGSVWVADAVDGALSRVDPRTGETLTIPVEASPIDVSVGEGSVWVVADAT